MKTLRTLGLASFLVLGGVAAASAAPMSIATGETLGATRPAVETVALVCGPYRCWHRPGWYGYHPYGYHPYGWHRWGWRRW